MLFECTLLVRLPKADRAIVLSDQHSRDLGDVPYNSYNGLTRS